ncbi:MAG: O-antigen ligase family protein [Bacteroidota bacterium]
MPEIPGNEIYYTIHILMAMGIVGWITHKSATRHKAILFVYGLFLMGGTILDVTTFKIPGIGFMEIQPDRFLFFFNIGYMVMLMRYPFNRDLLRKRWYTPSYEWAIYAYILFILIALTYHFPLLGFKDWLMKSIHFVSFLLMYWVLKTTMDKDLFKDLGKVFVIGAAISSVYAIMQFLVDPFFMRYGEMRIAYGSTVRSNGMFNTEYIHSYFVMAAFAWTLVMVKQNKLKLILSAIYLGGIVFTFHRMSWLIIVVFLGIYFLWFFRARLSVLGTLSIAGATLLVAIGMLFYDDIVNSQMVQERVNERIDSRFGYYDMVLSNIGNKPLFGYGNKKNDVYYYAMLRITKSLARATGEEGSIHNGYLSNLFYYGVPALIMFVTMIFLSLRFYLRLARVRVIYTIPFLFGVVFTIANMTNSFLPSKHVATILIILLGIFAGVWQNRVFSLSDPEITAEA